MRRGERVTPGGCSPSLIFVIAIFVTLFIGFNFFAVNHGSAVPKDRSLARLPLWRAGLHAVQPDRQVAAGPAGLLRNAAALAANRAAPTTKNTVGISQSNPKIRMPLSPDDPSELAARVARRERPPHSSSVRRACAGPFLATSPARPGPVAAAPSPSRRPRFSRG